MTLLLDTHALLWWLSGDRALSEAARAAIGDEDNRVLVSAASAWEIATKVRIGKLPGCAWLAANLPQVLRDQDFEPLEVSLPHALRAGGLPGEHRDPFDRMLIAQAVALDIPLVSNEALFDGYGVRRLW